MDFLVNNSLIESVFFLKVGDSTGTAFTMTVNDIQYLISARHVFVGHIHESNVTVELFHENIWKTIDGILHFHSNPNIDICVIQLPITIAPKYQFHTNSSIIFGQDLFMLGFPYGRFQGSGEINRKYPFPFVKKGFFSASETDPSGAIILYLDGHNNPGFSGGPVCYYNIHEKKAYLVSVISAYINQIGLISSPSGNIQYGENSGIVITYAIRHVIEIIEGISLK